MADQSLIVHIGANISGLSAGLTAASNQVSGFVRDTQKGFKAIGDLGKATVALASGMAIGIGYAVKVSADFESAFAGVKKTVNATDRELEGFRKGILAMSREMPATAEEIAGVAEAAGQLGIKNEAILGFTKTMVNMGVATNMSSDEAATALARLANITQMPQDKFENLGSTIVALGNNFATTEKEIVDMSLRLAGQGKQIGLTEAQIAALATAMSSVGIEAEAGGTAMSTVMKKIQNAVGKGGKSLEGFAKVAGMSSAQFKQAFEKDATSAILALVQGLGKSSAEGKNLTAILDGLGIKGIRESDTLLRLSGASNVLSDALRISGQAWDENTALANEAAQRYATFDSQLKMLRNTIKYIVMIMGDQFREVLTGVMKAIQPLLNQIIKLAEGFAKLSPATRHFIAGGTMLSTVLMLLGGLALILLSAIPGIVSGFGAIAAMFSITSLALFKIIAIAGGVVSAIILIAAAFYIAYNECETFRNAVNAAWAWIVNATKVTAEAIKTAFGASVTWLVQKFSEIKPALSAIGGWISETFARIADSVRGVFEKVSAVMGPIIGGIIDKLKNFGGEAQDAVKNAMNLDFSGIAEIAAKFIPSLIGFLLGGIPRLIIVGVNMISMIANGMGITVPELMNKVVESVTGMINSFVASLPKFLEAGVQIITGILNGILSQIPTLIGVITQLVNTFTTTLTTILPQLTTAGTQILTTLVLGIAVALPQLITAVIEIFTALLGAIIAALPTIINAGITVLSALISGIVQALPLIIGAGISLLNALIDGIISVLPLLIETALTLVMSVVQLLVQNLPVILDAGIQILMALIDGIVKILPILITTAIQLVFAIVDALIANLPAIINAGVKLVMALINGLIKIIPMLITTAIKLAVSIIKAIIDHLPQILKAGADLVLALITGLISIIGQLGSAAMKIGGKIIEEIKKVDLLEVGKNIIRGLISGIGSMASAVWDKAKEIANGVGGAIKKALNIHSPSREMMKLGVYTGEGFAKGIASMINNVKAITGDMALAALPESSTLSLAYETPSSAGMAAGVQASYDVNTKSSGLEAVLQKLDRKLDNLMSLTVNMDGHEVGRIVEPHVDSLQASKFGMSKYMSGMK